MSIDKTGKYTIREISDCESREITITKRKFLGLKKELINVTIQVCLLKSGRFVCDICTGCGACKNCSKYNEDDFKDIIKELKLEIVKRTTRIIKKKKD